MLTLALALVAVALGAAAAAAAAAAATAEARLLPAVCGGGGGGGELVVVRLAAAPPVDGDARCEVDVGPLVERGLAELLLLLLFVPKLRATESIVRSRLSMKVLAAAAAAASLASRSDEADDFLAPSLPLVLDGDGLSDVDADEQLPPPPPPTDSMDESFMLADAILRDAFDSDCLRLCVCVCVCGCCCRCCCCC